MEKTYREELFSNTNKNTGGNNHTERKITQITKKCFYYEISYFILTNV